MRVRLHLGALSGDRGGVMVTVALFAPVAVLFMSLALDVSSAYLHRRHLQLQADAGALAAAQAFLPCSNSAIEAAARQYSGYEGAPLYNTQLEATTGKVHELLNSQTYYGQASPVDTTASTEAPCKAGMIDVKITETEFPWYFKVANELIGGVPYINAHARVEILQEHVAKGAEPLAIAESAPTAVNVYYVNEDKANEILKSASLADTGPNGLGEEVWSNEPTPSPVEIKKTGTEGVAHIGVIVALAGKAGALECTEGGKPCLPCTHNFVKCFDSSATGPLLHIAGYSLSGTGSVTAPIARKVTMSGTTCSDGYYSTTTTSCTVSIVAAVDYGSAKTNGITIKPEIAGTKGAEMVFSATTHTWSGTATVPAASGSNEVSLIVECNPKAKESVCPTQTKATKVTLHDVQRVYSASTATSGSIGGAWLGVEKGATTGADSFEVCETQDNNSCTYNLFATVDVAGSLANAQKYSDPLYHMRFGNPTAEVVGCQPEKEASGAAYRENLENGCASSFVINTNDPGCTVTTEPYDCVGKASGVKTGPFRQGLTGRIEEHPPAGTRFYECSQWVDNEGGGVPKLPVDDSRIVQLFIEPYGSTGTASVPVISFATFYVTGWPGDPCSTDDHTGNGEIVGHFIKYINPADNEGGGEKCVLGSLTECVAALTR
jgi:Putative Flp pilus-assembly TadE/G-like